MRTIAAKARSSGAQHCTIKAPTTFQHLLGLVWLSSRTYIHAGHPWGGIGIGNIPQMQYKLRCAEISFERDWMGAPIHYECRLSKSLASGLYHIYSTSMGRIQFLPSRAVCGSTNASCNQCLGRSRRPAATVSGRQTQGNYDSVRSSPPC